MQSPNKILKVALVGNPNSGKSTLFNALTGLNQKTGNFPGVTVDKKSGVTSFVNEDGSKVISEIIDLPGIYSLQPHSMDEQVACTVLMERSGRDYPDITVVVVDATNLKRNLFLVTQIIELGRPVVIALNMFDMLQRLGTEINIQNLSDSLGVPVIPISARNNAGIEELKRELSKNVEASAIRFAAKPLGVVPDLSTENIERYNAIHVIVNGCLKTSQTTGKISLTERIDNIITHKILGYIIFLLVLFVIFQSIFFIATYPMRWIEHGFLFFSQWLQVILPAGELSDLLVNGVVSGLSGIVVFVPQIALLFGFMALLEETGYMARVSFIMDKLMRRFGLNGRSIIPLISGMACAVPAIMSARTIGNWKERLVTIMITPLMSCSARLPVYTLLISLAFPANDKTHFMHFQGLMLMSLYLLGFIAAVSAAFVMKFIIKTKEKSFFIMELPVYRMPQWGSVFYTMYEKVKVFLFDAGKVIIAIAIILWVLASHAPGDRFAEIENRHASSKELLTPEVQHKIASEKLQASYAGMLGKTIEPAIKPLGFDWKIGISLITSFAAREVFVGTMATIYSVGNKNNTQSIRERMLSERDPETGKLVYSRATSISLMLFFAFAMQCMSTLAVVFRETKGWKWPLIQFLYMGALAYLASWVAYSILS